MDGYHRMKEMYICYGDDGHLPTLPNTRWYHKLIGMCVYAMHIMHTGMGDVLTSSLLERHPSINGHVDRTDITKLWVATLEEQLGDFHVHASPHSIIDCGAPTGLYDDVRGATAEELFQLSRGNVDDQAEFGGFSSPHAPK